MLAKEFDKLDDDYITLKSLMLVNKNNQKAKALMEKLAEKGQINAIQDYFKTRDTRLQTNRKILHNVQQLLGEERNLEESYAVVLYLLDRGYKSDKELELIFNKYALCDGEDIVKFGIMRLNEILKDGLAQVQEAFFSGEPCAVLCERYAELVHETNKIGVLRDDLICHNANTLVATKMYDEFFSKGYRTANYIFAYSNFIKRRGICKKIDQNFHKLASRPLDFCGQPEQ